MAFDLPSLSIRTSSPSAGVRAFLSRVEVATQIAVLRRPPRTKRPIRGLAASRGPEPAESDGAGMAIRDARRNPRRAVPDFRHVWSAIVGAVRAGYLSPTPRNGHRIFVSSRSDPSIFSSIMATSSWPALEARRATLPRRYNAPPARHRALELSIAEAAGGRGT
jgi:hypothetical protein